MELNHSFSTYCAILFLFIGLTASASASTSPSPSSFISDGIFESHGSIGRNLLQAKKACPVNFEFLNYTIITSECKGPHYPAAKCCAAFTGFACPYAEVLNDLTNDCASTMFSYINLYGRYPPGLFSSECKGDKTRGLPCAALPPSALENDKNGSNIRWCASLFYMLTAGLLMLLFDLL